jgi:hypothetical protein
MKTITIIGMIILFIGSAFIVYGNFDPNKKGSFNPQTGKIICSTKFVCDHEDGHVLDKSLGYPSKSQDWLQAIKKYQSVYQPDSIYHMIATFPGTNGNEFWLDWNIYSDTCSLWSKGWGGYSELYAMIYAYSFADIDKIPKKLQYWYLTNDYK